MKKLFLLSALLLMLGSAFAQQTLYRYYNPQLGKHYYTINFAEYGNGGNGWYLDGPQCIVFDRQDRGLIPVFRYFNAGNSDHYYTVNFNELGRGTNGYVFEGKPFYIAQNGGPRLVPLFAFYNRRSGEHFLTTSKDEMNQDYTDFAFTGVIGYVIPVSRDADRAHFRGRDFYRGHH
jgi:hypothetical protein